MFRTIFIESSSVIQKGCAHSCDSLKLNENVCTSCRDRDYCNSREIGTGQNMNPSYEEPQEPVNRNKTGKTTQPPSPSSPEAGSNNSSHNLSVPSNVCISVVIRIAAICLGVISLVGIGLGIYHTYIYFKKKNGDRSVATDNQRLEVATENS